MNHLLVINGGSSSVKFAVFGEPPMPNRLLSGAVERVGSAEARLKIRRPVGEHQIDAEPVTAMNAREAVDRLLEVVEREFGLGTIVGVGHRIVHGGSRFVESCRIDEAVLAELKRLSPLAPAHLPGEIAIVEAIFARLRGVKQVACFDTAFHRSLPRVAYLLPLPRRYEAEGVRRYGFHGLSYAYLMEELRNVAGEATARGRVVLAHLGAGASMAAVRDGRCIDTSMAFTPTAGLVMGTRSGDLDPGVLTYLIREQGMSVDEVDAMLNRQSGLLGISETSADMRELEQRASHDPRAAEAIDMFCYQAKKWLGAYAAALGGLDTLVFSGGIGENSSAIRACICRGLEFLGVHLDAERNNLGAAVISLDHSPVSVRVIRTDEEAMIVREMSRLLAHEA